MKKTLFSFVVLLTIVCLSSKATSDITANHPDSVYVFTYHHGDATSGLRMAYSVDKTLWLPIGNDYSFVKCDFGTWGALKKMHDPSVLYTDGKWYAVWAVHPTANQFAMTQSKDFWLWKPQDYPYLSNGKNFEKPVLKKNGDTFELLYQTNDGYYYTIRSNDFKTWSAPERTSTATFKYIAKKTNITLNGKTYEGDMHKVPYTVVENLLLHTKDAENRNALMGDNCGKDQERFKDVVSVSATLDLTDQSKSISPNLIGIFFEDINYSADGGLYAELVQNRDFEYTELDRKEWNAQSYWTLGGEGASWEVREDSPIHENNKHYVALTSNGSPACIINSGFDGIVVKKGEKYDLSLFVNAFDKKQTLSVTILDGEDELAQTTFKVSGNEWKQHKAVLTPKKDADKATLCIELQEAGSVGLDFVSLFPQNTFKNRKNGLRPDLAQILADLKPQFVRFPGGCVSHGNGLGNMYRWIETVGPLWERKPQFNLWGYHQSKGLGFYEYFQFCEDIGAEPLPVLPAAVCCQNSSLGGHGQQGGLPMAEMDAYAQELMDLIEWANGDPKTNKFAKMRADAGHPKPFNLKMIGIGNEDLISDVFTERYVYIIRKIKAAYPDITIVGTVGPFYEGSDYERGWEIAREENIDVVDEHYYNSPGWFLHNQNYYDIYDRKGTKVYLGEWASWGTCLENGLVEALHVTNMERNGDVVAMASYAPLLAKHGHTQWNPDLIYFNNTEVFPTVSYQVQKLCGTNSGDHYIYSDLKATPMVKGRDGNPVAGRNNDLSLRLKASVVTESASGDLIIKLVNITPFDTPIKINLNAHNDYAKGSVEVLKGNPGDKDLKPESTTIQIADLDNYTVPAYSFTVIRLSNTTK